MTLPAASIAMFLYSQWQVWPELGCESSDSGSVPGLIEFATDGAAVQAVREGVPIFRAARDG